MVFSSIIADGEKGPLTTVTGRLPYATAKAALLGFTAQLAKDLAEWGITVNALMPGLILGEQGTRIRDKFDNLPTEQRAALLSGYPGGRPGTATRSPPPSNSCSPNRRASSRASHCRSTAPTADLGAYSLRFTFLPTSIHWVTSAVVCAWCSSGVLAMAS